MKTAQPKTQMPPKPAPVAKVEPEAQLQAQPPMLRCADEVSMLLNPYTQQVFTQSPTDAEIDGWVQSQLDAGKLVQC